MKRQLTAQINILSNIFKPMLNRIMEDKNLKSLANILTSTSNNSSEIYLSEQYKRKKRQNLGYYSRNTECFDFIMLINAWGDIVGKLLGQNSIPQKIQKKTLFIIAKHPVFAQELNMMGPEIILKIEQKIPILKNRIQRIKFTNANFSFEEFQAKESQSSKKLDHKSHPFSPEFRQKKQRANMLFNEIDDPELKEILCNLFIKNF